MRNTITMSQDETAEQTAPALPPITIDNLPDILTYAVKSTEWTALTPVQSVALPYMFAQRDVMVQARTGSGKTAAFVLPIVNHIDPLDDACQALILVPTRELAIQVERETQMLSESAGVRTVAVYGGVKYKRQIDAFKEGAHIVIGTPGRVLDHLMRRSLRLDALTTLVFDEADRMLSMGFYPDMKQIQRHLPERAIHTAMFSATFPPHVMRLAKEFMVEPEFLNLSQDNVHVTEVEHAVYNVPLMEKDRALVRIIEKENPANAIIFCNTRQRVNYVTVVLQRFGYDADQLSSDLSQSLREQVLERVREGNLRFLVATDVAARGIDIPELSHVIQYEVPEDQEQYIHRAGRTGRAGATGEALLLVEGMEQVKMHQIAKKYGISFVERPVPDDEEIAAVVGERVVTLLESKLRERDKLRRERLERFVALAGELAKDEEEGALLLAMLLDDYYQQTLHNPPPLPSIEQSKSSSGRSGGGRSGGGRSRRRGGGRRN
ncbi:MAG: DEAD/DEAH box helicase [Anaerolineales bacterium]|nr:DEAD/DEAH box helicase [Anaerolineales bacterium]